MKSPITKYAAVAAIIVALMLSTHFWNKATPSAYAFEQTIEALQVKRSFHIQTYVHSRPKDTFWAEFDEDGKLIRYRQEDNNGLQENERPIVTVWESNIRSRYYPKADIYLVTTVDNTEPELVEFDPQIMVQQVYDRVAEGEATIEVQEPTIDEEFITITVSQTDDRSLGRILLVDPDTKLVIRADNCEWDNEGELEIKNGIEVLGYNQPLDVNTFSLNPPEGTIIIDQISQEVGMAQGDMSDEQVASRLVREALEAWAAGDYTKAGILFGGAPPELLTERFGHLQPVSVALVGQPAPVEYRKPWFQVPCRYEVVRDGRIEGIEWIFNAIAVDGQPGRWYVSIERTP